MRIFRKRAAPAADPEPPAGVILHYRGRAIGCWVLRDEGQDRGGIAAWVAVPGEAVTIAAGEEFRVTATVLPDRSLLIADFASRPASGDEWRLPG